MTTRKESLYAFGPFRLDGRQRLLFRDGEVIPLPLKAFDTLLMLVENAGEVVEKDDLLKRIWPDTFVEEGSLAQNIWVLRKVLGEDSNGQPYIQTIPKRGYRFVAPVVFHATDGNKSDSVAAAPRPKRWLAMYVLAAAGVLVLTAATILLWMRLRTTPLTDQDVLVLADFTNSTGDHMFDATLRDALAFQLEQSPFLKVLDDEVVRQDLRLMRLSAGAHITNELAHDICVREAEKAMLAGSVASLGGSYVIELKATNCQTGATLARAQAEAADKEHVLQALANAAQGMRARLGESLSSIQKLAPPEFGVTTSSLEAFQAYTQGQNLFQQSRNVEAIPLLRKATELDPNFALAWLWLASASLNTGANGNRTLSQEYADHARALRDRVSEYERLWLSSSQNTGQLESAIEENELWKHTFPRDSVPFTMLGLTHEKMGDFEEALRNDLEAYRLAPRRTLNVSSIIVQYTRLDRFEEAKDAAWKQLGHDFDNPLIHRALLKIAWMENDQDAAAKQIQWFTGTAEEQIGLEDQAAYARMLGRLRLSRELLERAADLAQKRNAADVAARLLAPNADGEALLGNCAAARKSPASSAVTLALCGDASMMQHAEVDAEETSRVRPRDTLWNGVRLPLIRAAMEYRRGHPAKAIDFLRSVKYERAYPFATYLRGLAYLKSRQGTEAAAEFQKIVDHKGANWGPLYALSYVGLARATALHGDNAHARKSFEEFLSLWKDADPDVPILTQVRNEYARLIGGNSFQQVSAFGP
jgi:DNA-binding winged helix-turn-helix (wHTH) protein/tetratricopeptide (TPR) repeat protein